MTRRSTTECGLPGCAFSSSRAPTCSAVSSTRTPRATARSCSGARGARRRDQAAWLSRRRLRRPVSRGGPWPVRRRLPRSRCSLRTRRSPACPLTPRPWRSPACPLTPRPSPTTTSTCGSTSHAKTLDGRERVTWRNPVRATRVSELWLHLYLNAFRNSESTFVRESGGQLRGDRMPDERLGLDRRHVAPPRGRRRTSRRRSASSTPTTTTPTTGRSSRVPLPEPVPPGGDVALDVAWKAQLPRVFARTGYVRDYFLVGQWFPKLGVYEPAGMRGPRAGRLELPPVPRQLGVLRGLRPATDVEITLPRALRGGRHRARALAAVEPRTAPSTHVYEQADVIDFAWTASPRLRRGAPDVLGAASDVTPAGVRRGGARCSAGRLDEVRLTDVEIIAAAPAGAPAAGRAARARRPRRRSSGSACGTAATRTGRSRSSTPPTAPAARAAWSTRRSSPPGRRLALSTAGRSTACAAPEEVTVHEFGHQYWQSMVATNEFEESWLDEGFNSYSTAQGHGACLRAWLIQLARPAARRARDRAHAEQRDRMFDAHPDAAPGRYSPGNYALQLLQPHRPDAAHARGACRPRGRWRA